MEEAEGANKRAGAPRFAVAPLEPLRSLRIPVRKEASGAEGLGSPTGLGVSPPAASRRAGEGGKGSKLSASAESSQCFSPPSPPTTAPSRPASFFPRVYSYPSLQTSHAFPRVERPRVRARGGFGEGPLPPRSFAGGAASSQRPTLVRQTRVSTEAPLGEKGEGLHRSRGPQS